MKHLSGRTDRTSSWVSILGPKHGTVEREGMELRWRAGGHVGSEQELVDGIELRGRTGPCSCGSSAEKLLAQPRSDKLECRLQTSRRVAEVRWGRVLAVLNLV
eukprot:3929967-Pleurochrysis_carterae.AAC.1